MAKLNGLRFLEALEYAKVGNKIRRAAYDGGEVCFYVPPEILVAMEVTLRPTVHGGALCYGTREGRVHFVWLTMDDVLADDWDVIA